MQKVGKKLYHLIVRPKMLKSDQRKLKDQHQMAEYKGEKITVNFCSKLCIGTGECGRATGDLFVDGRDPWCDPDQSESLAVKEIIERCPSGALTAEADDRDIRENAASRNTVHVTQNGPYYIRGDLEIVGAPKDYLGTKYRAALCRCGHSKNKPFCDGSHISSGFKDSGAVGKMGDTEFECGGPIIVEPQKDASLLVKGNLTIHAGTGREAWHGKRVALCRCGASKNKPFCDGSHKDIGFKSS